MKNFFRKYSIYLLVSLISTLLLSNILLTRFNKTIIEENRGLQQDTDRIKANSENIGPQIIQALDIGLRGFALVQEPIFAAPMDSAVVHKDSILDDIKLDLEKQHYPDNDYDVLRDSVNAYIRYCFNLKDILSQGKREAFLTTFKSDKGLSLWQQYLQCLTNISNFEDKINQEATLRYEAALRRNSILQIILFIVCFPTLIYTAFHAQRTVGLAVLLRLTEADKNKILTEQNINLEKIVAERTREILAKSEELQSQSEEIISQNQRLTVAQQIIEQQNQEIQSKNEQLELDVNTRTQELKHANKELIQQNNQLEQFAFIAAHNLRAPLASILGLANLLKFSEDPAEKDVVIKKMIGATLDLDCVIQDLNTILDVKKHTSNITEVNLANALNRSKKTLEREFEETKTQLVTDFKIIDKVIAVPPYIESILYNLLSNAIKYRHPDRVPQINISSDETEKYVVLRVSDNGLGIDLDKHRLNVFSLYKRFHLHTEGRGLGLYLIKTQMAALGGKIEVQSEVDKGTTFILYFKKNK
jgi:signal transduction histidine kinase